MLIKLSGTWYEMETTLENRKAATLVVQNISRTNAEILFIKYVSTFVCFLFKIVHYFLNTYLF